MKAVREWAVFLWEYYIVRTWVYYFPPKHEDDAGSEEG